MPVTFDVLPSNPINFTPPALTITAVDTTPAVSGVTMWEWYFNDTLVSTASTWTNTFFCPIVGDLQLVVYNVLGFGSASSVDVPITVLDALPTILSFDILPSDRIEINDGTDDTTAINVTAIDTSPSVSAITGWSWDFNGAVVSTADRWVNTFFGPCTGDITLTVTSSTFTGLQIIGPQTLEIFDDEEDTLPPITPPGVRASTTYNHAITSFELLADRIALQLGAPLINLEACDVQIFDFINQAVEWYSKYAGYTEEFLAFTSRMYVRNVGIRLDHLFGFAGETNTPRDTQYGSISGIYDYDLNSLRKVIDVHSFEPGESTGVNTLFTLEQAMAQQTYWSYMLGNAGFDLVTWETLKQWLDLRTKVLAQTPYFRFDPRTQILRITPDPFDKNLVGVVGCYVERPVRDLIQERWVQRYALALTKISIGNVRGKYGSVQLFGGGTPNYNDLLSQGLSEKEALENEILGSYGEVTPPRFFLG
jgi:hypothetical protein